MSFQTANTQLNWTEQKPHRAALIESTFLDPFFPELAPGARAKEATLRPWTRHTPQLTMRMMMMTMADRFHLLLAALVLGLSSAPVELHALASAIARMSCDCPRSSTSSSSSSSVDSFLRANVSSLLTTGTRNRTGDELYVGFLAGYVHSKVRNGGTPGSHTRSRLRRCFDGP